MRRYAHVDFRAIPPKLNFIHARGHKMNSPSAVFPQILRYRHIIRIKSVTLIPNQDRQRVIGFAGVDRIEVSRSRPQFLPIDSAS
jgi:hypothetical protein